METGNFFGADLIDDFEQSDEKQNNDTKMNSLNKRNNEEFLQQQETQATDKKKSKKEIYKEIIRKSKEGKYQRVRDKEDQNRAVQEMKSDYMKIFPKLSLLGNDQLKNEVKQGESDEDDTDFYKMLYTVQNQGLVKPEREKKVVKDSLEEGQPDNDDNEDEDEENEEYDESDADDNFKEFKKNKIVKYDPKKDLMEDYEIKERDKQKKKFGEKLHHKEDQIMQQIFDLEDQDDHDNEDDNEDEDEIEEQEDNNIEEQEEFLSDEVSEDDDSNNEGIYLNNHRFK